MKAKDLAEILLEIHPEMEVVFIERLPNKGENPPKLEELTAGVFQAKGKAPVLFFTKTENINPEYPMVDLDEVGNKIN